MSKQLTPVEDLKHAIEDMRPQFQKALPAHIPAEKFVRVVQTAIATNPDIAKASKQSVFAATMKCAQDGLLPDGREAAFVIYFNKGAPTVQYMPMIGGILKKIRNSGELASITAELVYDRDDFKFWVDDNGQHIHHAPNMWEDRGELMGAYALAKTKDGALYIEIMSRKQIEDVKNASRAKTSGPWAGAFETEMWRKTVIRRLAKRLPMSTDLDEFIRQDDDLYDFAPEPKEVTPQEPAKKSRKLQAILTKPEAVEVKEEESPEVTEGDEV